MICLTATIFFFLLPLQISVGKGPKVVQGELPNLHTEKGVDGRVLFYPDDGFDWVKGTPPIPYKSDRRIPEGREHREAVVWRPGIYHRRRNLIASHAEGSWDWPPHHGVWAYRGGTTLADALLGEEDGNHDMKVNQIPIQIQPNERLRIRVSFDPEGSGHKRDVTKFFQHSVNIYDLNRRERIFRVDNNQISGELWIQGKGMVEDHKLVPPEVRSLKHSETPGIGEPGCAACHTFETVLETNINDMPRTVILTGLSKREGKWAAADYKLYVEEPREKDKLPHVRLGYEAGNDFSFADSIVDLTIEVDPTRSPKLLDPAK